MRSFLIVGIVLVFLYSCKKIQDPVFKQITNIKLIKAGLAMSSVGFDVEYFNPNKKGGKLKEAEGDAWIDSVFVGHFRVDTLMNIPGNANFTIPVKMEMDMNSFLKLSLAGFKNEDVPVRIKGVARVGRGGIYKKFPINYEGKQNLVQLMK